MSPLHEPPQCFETSFFLDGLGLFSTLADMGCKAKFVKDIADFLPEAYIWWRPFTFCLLRSDFRKTVMYIFTIDRQIQDSLSYK